MQPLDDPVKLYVLVLSHFIFGFKLKPISVTAPLLVAAHIHVLFTTENSVP